MKVALIMPIMDTGEKGANSAFKFIHDTAKGKINWNRAITPITNRIKFLDREHYPNGLIQLGTILKIANHEVKIFNFLERDYTQEIITFKPHVVGITCSSGPNLVWIDKFARFLKKELKCLILLGGPHVTLLPEQTLETTIADYVFIGEADFVLLDLINFLEGKISRFPEEGICYKKMEKLLRNALQL